MTTPELAVIPIGVGAAYARTGEVQSSYLVRAGDTTLCLDLGAGALNALQAHVRPQDVDAYVISHRHPDHCVDVLPLHVYMYWGPGRGTRARVLSPVGVEGRLKALGSETGWDDALRFEPVHGGSVVHVDDVRLRFAEVPHIPDTLAVRVDHGRRSLVYGADCTENEALMKLAKGADLLIAECGDGPTPNALSPHMSGGEAGGIAARAKVKQLLLTHCFPEHDRDATIAAARAACPNIPVEWAIQGRLYPV
ncbi:MAG TPA: MBL fold metallo-hydrolase [Miltoncostaeales bacterium]|nr:MBL fold metallo-hydrolase [Miltoncostaeales bacterium]